VTSQQWYDAWTTLRNFDQESKTCLYFYHDTHSRCEESLYPVLLCSFVLRSSSVGYSHFALPTPWVIWIWHSEINRAESLLAQNFISRWKFHRARLKVLVPRKNTKTPLTTLAQSLAIWLVSFCCLRHTRTVVYDVMRQSRSCKVSRYGKSRNKNTGVRGWNGSHWSPK